MMSMSIVQESDEGVAVGDVEVQAQGVTFLKCMIVTGIPTDICFALCRSTWMVKLDIRA